MRTVKVNRVVKNTPRIRTFYFKDRRCAKSNPGQFVMIWLPGVDEIPMSLSSAHRDGSASITAAKVGEATSLLHQKQRGDVIGIRGPLGNSFELIKGKALVVGGGSGVGPLVFLTERLLELKTRITFLVGAKTRVELPLVSKIQQMFPEKEAEHKVFIATEDGSRGYKGTVTELAQEFLAQDRFNMIYSCGKESMLLKVLSLARTYEVPLQVSLERLMRCAIGLCGSCTIGEYRVCVDGPIFTDRQLLKLGDEFGRLKRDFDGRKVPV